LKYSAYFEKNLFSCFVIPDLPKKSSSKSSFLYDNQPD